ncbi:translocation protein TolB [Granulicella sp. 5B5]|uniref:PD40 domain-containing protein n=1 Tax=Granulicella sp. 5B5 TaxID=1617967 RepID=UPI0015F3D942|nr:PD40 domain-containing protein [Granulicella sp. 5B5]QMV17385.1 translocation protein TolB [Granulicella sp. 5B5]
MNATRQGLLLTTFSALLTLSVSATAYSQDWNILETGKNASASTRLAAADFKPMGGDPSAAEAKHVFDATLYADLASAGIFDVVSKSQNPEVTPGNQAEMNLSQWSVAPASAAYVAFGNFSVQNGKVVVNGFLDDAKNTQYPQIFTKLYTDDAGDEGARQTAHEFADDIILRLGGTAGIAETKIFYTRKAGVSKEIWMMDYDGANQHQLTHLGEVAIGPRVSPDNSRVAFSSLGKNGFQIKMYSLLLGRMVAFSSVGGTNLSPAWSPSGEQIAFSSSRTGDPEIWISDPQGSLAHRVTSFAGPDVSPTWNPKTGAQIAWISGRSGLPQLYIMDADGSGVVRMTDGGYATSPSWSPNGQFIAFAWDRKYGPGAPGGQDIYVMEIATKRWIQLTHDIGRCDFPSWSPDGRHIVFANEPNGRDSSSRIMSMLADGTQKRVLTGAGTDMPNWSWK